MSDYSVFIVIFNSYSSAFVVVLELAKKVSYCFVQNLLHILLLYSTSFLSIPYTIKCIYVSNWNALQKFQSSRLFVYVVVYVCCTWLFSGVANRLRWLITTLGSLTSASLLVFSALAQQLANNIKTSTSPSTHHITSTPHQAISTSYSYQMINRTAFAINTAALYYSDIKWEPKELQDEKQR